MDDIETAMHRNDFLFGVRVVVNALLPPGAMYAIGEFDKPDGWATMSKAERFAAAVANGAVVCVHDLADLPIPPTTGAPAAEGDGS